MKLTDNHNGFSAPLSEHEQVVDSLALYLAEVGCIPLLTLEAEQEIYAAIKAGDPHAWYGLVQPNLRLVVHLARRLANAGTGLPDAIGLGNLRLIEAARSFNPDIGVPFAAYATLCIVRATRRAWQRESRAHLGAMSLHEPVATGDDGDELILLDVVASGSPDPGILEFARQDAAIAVASAIDSSNLTRFQRDRLVAQLAGMTIAEIAAAESVSESSVTSALKAARDKLFQHAGETGLADLQTELY